VAHLTPHGKARLIARINAFTSLSDLAGWWENNLAYPYQRDPDIIAAKDAKKGQLDGT